MRSPSTVNDGRSTVAYMHACLSMFSDTGESSTSAQAGCAHDGCVGGGVVVGCDRTETVGKHPSEGGQRIVIGKLCKHHCPLFVA